MVPLGREQAVDTNHPCIWYRLAAICNAGWGCQLPLWGQGGRMGSDMDGSPGYPGYDFL